MSLLSQRGLLSKAKLLAKFAAGGLSAAGAAYAVYDTFQTIKAKNLAAQTPNDYNANELTQFPVDLPNINGQMFCILFNFFQYDRPTILSPPTLVPFGSIALPIPSDLLDISDVSYSEQGSGLMFGSMLESFAGQKGSISGGLQNAARGFAQQTDSTLINQGGGALGTGADASSLANKTYQMAGLAQNPFLSVLFNAPTFKRHIFSWTFIPESAQDQAVLKFILNKFRYHSLPDIASTNGGLLLTYPDMCWPKIIPAGYMYDFKQCVVEGMSINLAPGDTPVFQAGTQAPASIKFTVKLLEIEYWIKSDILATQSPNPIDGYSYTS